VVHLTQQQADEIYAMVTSFIDANSARVQNTIPFEYAFILYNAGNVDESKL
jgi:hypothetical protein